MEIPESIMVVVMPAITLSFGYIVWKAWGFIKKRWEHGHS
jgi:hypothetical protein